MTAGGGWDELLAEAKQRLADQEAEEQEVSGELGESVELAEGQAFTGRWRGDGTASTRRGLVDVPLFWDGTGARRFFWPKTRLTSAIDEHRPIDIGAAIAIVRGADIPNSDPDRSPTQRYAVSVRASADPLPDEEPAPVSGRPAFDDDIPF